MVEVERFFSPQLFAIVATLQKDAFVLDKKHCFSREGKSWWRGGAGQGGQYHHPQQGLWGVIAAHRNIINLIKELQPHDFHPQT